MSKTIAEIPEKIDDVFYFCQKDPRWTDVPYTITDDPAQTIGTTGCSSTLQAVVQRNVCDMESSTPIVTAQWNIDNGLRTADNGTLRLSWDVMAWQLGLKMNRIKQDVPSIGRALLQHGGFVIYSAKAPTRERLGTPAGHLIGLRDVDERGRLLVIDVNSPDKSQESWSPADVFEDVNSNLVHLWRPETPAVSPQLRVERPKWLRRSKL